MGHGAWGKRFQIVQHGFTWFNGCSKWFNRCSKVNISGCHGSHSFDYTLDRCCHGSKLFKGEHFGLSWFSFLRLRSGQVLSWFKIIQR
jgi:hypothetical protein